jgi:hypothetical protein
MRFLETSVLYHPPDFRIRGLLKSMPRFGVLIVMLACAGLIIPGGAAVSQVRPGQAEVWDLTLGNSAESLPDGFTDYACGTNGGPPSTPLKGFRDFRRCRPEPSGLREVYFRYDDEVEYWAKANDLPMEIEKYSGTKAYGFPVVVSALFSENNALAGLRVVSDPRDTSRRREEAYSLRNFLTARFGRDGWQCTDLPREDGEEPVGRTFIKQQCRKIDGGRAFDLTTHYFRKPGQRQFDSRTDRETEGQFESLVRFEWTLKP